MNNINIEAEKELIDYILQKKTKTIKLSEIYKKLKLPYAPQNDKIIKNILNNLEEKGYIQPLKTTNKNVQGIFEKYKILNLKQEEEEKIKEEILKLDEKIKIDYFLKYPKEYIKNKELIIPINEFIKQTKEKKIEEITVNERSYQLYKNEKHLKENESILKKLGLTYKDLYAYDTYEPFFYYINTEYKNKKLANKTILIIENKDTFWTMVKAIQNLKIEDIYMVIYGEGKKILKSFLFIKEFKIDSKDNIYYFGDIDFEGINIYVALKEKYIQYNISAYIKGYRTILDIENTPEKIKTNQNINPKKLEKFISEFNDKKYKDKLIKIFNNKKYIPQEVFNYEVASKNIK